MSLDELLALAQADLQRDQARAAVQRLAPFEALDSGPLLRLYGEALRRAGQDAQAVGVLMRAITLKPDDSDAYRQLAFAFQGLRMPDQAAECFRTVATLEPASVMAQGYLIHAAQAAADWRQFDADLAALHAALGGKPEGAADEFGMPFALVGLPHSPEQMRRAAELASRHLTRGITPLPPRPPTPRPRLRVGYLSADFHAHATAALIVELLSLHDAPRFEVFVFSHGPDDASTLRSRIRSGVEHFIDVADLDHAALAARVRAEGIDILIDLKGHTAHSRMASLAYRPAPVQVSWLGFPGTSGAHFIDYLIGDPIVTPLDQADQCTEAIAQLPHCYQPNDSQRPPPRPPPRTSLGLREDAVVLLGANAVYKITPPLWACWMEILHRLPQAQLWQLSGGEVADARLRQAAHASGIGPERLVFAPATDMPSHHARLAAADLGLDSWPCTGHTTTSDCLSAGVPVVTLRGAGFAARVAASLLEAVGLHDCICADAQSYTDRVCALATDTAQRLALHRQLLARPGPLYDSAGLTRDLEALYERMWARCLAGKAPAALPAQRRTMSCDG